MVGCGVGHLVVRWTTGVGGSAAEFDQIWASLGGGAESLNAQLVRIRAASKRLPNHQSTIV